MSFTKRRRELAPERLYPLRVYNEASGIAPTRIREARLQGLVLPTVRVGKLKFVRGSDGIEFIEALSELKPPQA